jgi:hypothetical protein
MPKSPPGPPTAPREAEQAAGPRPATWPPSLASATAQWAIAEPAVAGAPASGETLSGRLGWFAPWRQQLDMIDMVAIAGAFLSLLLVAVVALRM